MKQAEVIFTLREDAESFFRNLKQWQKEDFFIRADGYHVIFNYIEC